MKSPVPDTGFVYVATGERYVLEAAASAASLRRVHPDARVCLVTDAARGVPFWDDLVLLPSPRFGFRDKLEMRHAPYARCVFLDTDTTVVAPLDGLFALLARYPVCGVQISEGQDYEMPDGIPACFPEMNSGVIGFQTGAATGEFFSQWLLHYDRFQELNQSGAYHYANVGDQKSLRAALWHSGVRHACVGGEFNFIPFRLELASLPVAVLHTRATHALAPLAARLNAALGRRVYLPSLDVVLMDNPAPAELRRLTAAVLRLWARALGRSLAPRAARDRLRRIGWIQRRLFGNRHESPAGAADLAKWRAPAKPSRHE